MAVVGVPSHLGFRPIGTVKPNELWKKGKTGFFPSFVFRITHWAIRRIGLESRPDLTRPEDRTPCPERSKPYHPPLMRAPGS